MQIQMSAAATLATQMRDDARAARMEARAEKKVDEVVEGDEPSMTVENQPAETEELPGVLRLLQEGHFRGVADVRLRIVHADKIAAVESQQVRSDITDSSESLKSSISSTVTKLAQVSDSISDEQADAAIAAFEEQVGASIDTSFASGTFDPGAIETSLQAAFQTLVEQLELGSAADELTTDGIETPVETEAVVNESAEEDIEASVDTEAAANESHAGSRDFLAELNEIFSAALSGMLAQAVSTTILPPISEPNGNGHAFEKFLAVYSEIQYGDDAVDEPSMVEIDV